MVFTIEGAKGQLNCVLKLASVLVPNYAPRERSEVGVLMSRPNYDMLLLPTSVQLAGAYGPSYKPAKPANFFGGSGVYVLQTMADKKKWEGLKDAEVANQTNAIQEDQIAYLNSLQK
eukprot:TRINITY_DN4880_c0_g1_i1.p2 TRINITY_DN4880_c0_g1~~TRINITY_DN4880_c0_g1_i1.p2  ORF type:complete len:117 (+),score=25.00 TRINITY_DN4880_c0_g1_i1:759-1109(+)